jgi:hypothetical protein
MNKSNPPKRKRRWYRFSLRTLLLFVLVVGVGLGWLGSKLQPLRNERRAAAEIEKLGGRVTRGLVNRGLVLTRVQLEGPTDRWVRSVFGFPSAFVNDVELKGTEAADRDLACLKDLPNLEFLTLDGTKITNDGLAHLAGLDNLLVLTLNNTQVGDAGMVHLRKLANLRILDLGRTRVTDAGIVQIEGLDELRQVNVAATKVTDRALNELQAALPQAENLVSLKAETEIRMAVAEIERLGGAFFAVDLRARVGGPVERPVRVNTLSLETARDIDAVLREAEKLTKLECLDLRGTPVTDAGLERVKGLTSLRALDLAHTQVTDAALAHLTGLTSLRGLDLRHTQVTEEGVKKFQEAVPNCKIQH